MVGIYFYVLEGYVFLYKDKKCSLDEGAELKHSVIAFEGVGKEIPSLSRV
jgi:hypothetical protein